jgi:hypothetical protein
MNDPARCGWCGNYHATKCPLVKALEYHSDGRLARVEFFAPNDYPQTVIAPEPSPAHKFKTL